MRSGWAGYGELQVSSCHPLPLDFAAIASLNVGEGETVLWMFMPLRRYFDFSGRSCRKEFWSFFLLQCIAVGALIFWIYRSLVEVGLRGETGHSVTTFTSFIGPAFSLFGLFILSTIIPSISVQVRRFHDQNLSG